MWNINTFAHTATRLIKDCGKKDVVEISSSLDAAYLSDYVERAHGGDVAAEVY